MKVQCLSIDKQNTFIQRSKNEESGKALAVEYGVVTSTILDIKQNSDSILTFISVLDSEEG